MDLISFGVIAFLAIASPGPNIVLIILTSIDNGLKAGFITVFSVSFAMLMQALVVIFLLDYLLTIDNFLLYVQWFGILYFAYLTFDALIATHRSTTPAPVRLISTALIIALSNPKTLIFFSVLFPQFVTSTQHQIYQMSILTAIFLAIALVCDSVYVVFASSLRHRLQNARKIKIIKVVSYLIITLYLLYTR